MIKLKRTALLGGFIKRLKMV